MPAMSTELPAAPSPVSSGDFSGEQKRYLEGFFAALNARGVSFGDLSPTPAAPAAASQENLDDLTKEERIKRELHGSSR